MNKLITLALAAALGACAGDTAERRPAATAQTEPVPEHAHARHVEPAVHPTVADDRAARPIEPARGPDADNTALNTRERSGVTPTPLDQGNGSSDLDTTQKIRKALMQDDNLSFAAKNVKVVSDSGQVTLRGTVKSDAEKRAIEKYAREVAGAARVHNELDVEQ